MYAMSSPEIHRSRSATPPLPPMSQSCRRESTDTGGMPSVWGNSSTAKTSGSSHPSATCPAMPATRSAGTE